MFLKRFLDDLFMIFTGSAENLHKFLAEINKLHPGIKFTMTHTRLPSDTSCNCDGPDNLPFLDTSLKIVDGRIQSDLYRKPSDKNKYLLPSSCHPPHTSKNIPFSLALRIIRICSEPEQRDARLSELKEMLLSRDYPPNIINAAIARARNIPRQDALKKVIREKSTGRAIFVVTFDTRLPSVQKIIIKHWRTMVKNDLI